MDKRTEDLRQLLAEIRQYPARPALSDRPEFTRLCTEARRIRAVDERLLAARLKINCLIVESWMRGESVPHLPMQPTVMRVLADLATEELATLTSAAAEI